MAKLVEKTPNDWATIWRYDLAQGAVLDVPAGAQILDVSWWEGGPKLWTLADPTMPRIKRPVDMLSTGYELRGAGWEYAGKIESPDGRLWFVFLGGV